MKRTITIDESMPIESGRLYWHRVLGYAVRLLESDGDMVRYQRTDGAGRIFRLKEVEFRMAYEDGVRAPCS